MINDRILSHIFQRHIHKHHVSVHMNISPLMLKEKETETVKLRGVAIDVMVTVLDVTISLLDSPYNKDKEIDSFIDRLYTEYQLFDILIQNIIAETGVVKINVNEYRLAARAMSLMP